MLRKLLTPLALLVGLTACQSDGGGESSPAPGASAETTTGTTASADQLTRIEVVQTQLDTWAGTGDLATAQEAAEGVINLVVGSEGPYYGDATGNDVVTGGTGSGLLPGLDGQPGLADTDSTNQCVVDDVLGGSWEDPADRWDTLDTAIDEWSTSNNTYPALPSHPQRVVGWARLTLEADTVEEATEYAGHAQIHVDASRDAYACS